MFGKLLGLSKKCFFCKKAIKGEQITADVKVPGLVGLHEKHFCSEDHYSKYQAYIKEYEKKRKIPMSNCSVCTSCMKK
jgi:hypothetical protein